MDFIKAKEIGFMLGIKFDNMTVSRVELIHLKNDGLTVKEIALLLDVPLTTAQHWFDKQSMPKDRIIEKLETMHLKRINKIIDFEKSKNISLMLGLAFHV